MSAQDSENNTTKSGNEEIRKTLMQIKINSGYLIMPSAKLVAMTLTAVPSGAEEKVIAVTGAGVTTESTNAPFMV